MQYTTYSVDVKDLPMFVNRQIINETAKYDGSKKHRLVRCQDSADEEPYFVVERLEFDAMGEVSWRHCYVLPPAACRTVERLHKMKIYEEENVSQLRDRFYSQVEVIKKLQAAVDDLHRRLTAAKVKNADYYESVIADHDDTIKQLARKNAELVEKYVKARHEVDSRRKICVDMRRENNQLREARGEMSRQLMVSDRRLRESGKLLATTRERMQALDEDVRTMRALEKEAVEQAAVARKNAFKEALGIALRERKLYAEDSDGHRASDHIVRCLVAHTKEAKR